MSTPEEEDVVQAISLISDAVVPYIASAYNTLVSVVQGVALGALFYIIQTELSKQAATPISLDGGILWSKITLAFLTICTIWHRYIVENQYVIWRLGVFDTLIPISFAVLQIFFILSIFGEPVVFLLWITALFVCGFAAYANAVVRLGKAECKPIYRHHFSKLDAEFGEHFQNAILSYNRKSARLMGLLAISAAALTCLIYLGHLDQREGSLVALTFGLASCLSALLMDLRRQLNSNSAIALNKYGLRW